MTREEAKNIVAQQLSGLLSNPLVTLDEKYVEAEKMAIKALEQKPCEDIDYDLRINFYPMKKNGERSLNSSGWFNNERILTKFKPFDGGDTE